MLDDSIKYFYGNIIQGQDYIQNIQPLSFLKTGKFSRVKFCRTASKGFIFWYSNVPGNTFKIFYSELRDNTWQEPAYMELPQSYYPVLDFEAGSDADGNIHLFLTSQSVYWQKLAVFSSNKNWKDPFMLDYAAGKMILYTDYQFFVHSERGYNGQIISDFGIYAPKGDKWSINFSTFYGKPNQVLSTNIPGETYYIVGTGKLNENYFPEVATVRNSVILEQMAFDDVSLDASTEISAIQDNEELILIWQQKSGKGIRYIKYYPQISAVENKNSEHIETGLDQNYPNPFNSETRISYTLGEAGDHSLKLYDMLGREVYTIEKGWQSAGKHTTEFDAAGLPSGIYIYQLASGERTYSRKMILVK